MEREPFGAGEWYHCYSRGVEKRIVFERTSDYERFIDLLYVCNSMKPIHRSDQLTENRKAIYTLERAAPLVSIGAYCLMPNHFHLLLKDATEEGDGISRFMQKLGTAYTMYFNISRERTGGLFVKPFRSRHVADDRYFHRVASYIHFNPVELFEPHWKEGHIKKPAMLEKQLRAYRFSSLTDHESVEPRNVRPEFAILDVEAIEILSTDRPQLLEALEEMQEYYISLSLL